MCQWGSVWAEAFTAKFRCDIRPTTLFWRGAQMRPHPGTFESAPIGDPEVQTPVTRTRPPSLWQIPS